MAHGSFNKGTNMALNTYRVRYTQYNPIHPDAMDIKEFRVVTGSIDAAARYAVENKAKLQAILSVELCNPKVKVCTLCGQKVDL